MKALQVTTYPKYQCLKIQNGEKNAVFNKPSKFRKSS